MKTGGGYEVKTIVATIKPEHVSNLRKRIKGFEVRKTAPTPPFKVLVCKSGSRGDVVAEFIVNEVLKTSMNDILAHNKLYLLDEARITWDGLCAYMHDHRGTRPIYFWKVSDFIDYYNTKGRRVLKVTELGLKRPPQSWQYIERGDVDHDGK